MEAGFYKCSDIETTISDWVSLNFPSVPTEVVSQLALKDEACGTESLEHLNPTKCEDCNGEGKFKAEDDIEDEWSLCLTCDGDGHRDHAMAGYPAGWGTMWQAVDHPELVEALDKAGFEVYRTIGDMPFDCILFGVDGGGYGFFEAHWSPLRAHLCLAIPHETKTPAMLAHLEAVCEKEESNGGETFRRRMADYIPTK